MKKVFNLKSNLVKLFDFIDSLLNAQSEAILAETKPVIDKNDYNHS